MQHPDEGMIHTWLDGELSAKEAAALEAHAATCEQCKAAIAEARGFVAASSRIVSSLDAVPAGVIPIAKKPAKRMWYSSSQFRVAAAVLFVAGASLLVMRNGTQKATMALSTRSEANEASTAQRVMTATGPSSASSSAPVQPPVVADQAAANAAVAKPVVSQAPKEVATLSAHAPAANANAARKAVANEADFSGKGIKGGAAFGVAAGVPAGDTSAIASEPAMKAADALRPRTAFVAQPELKVLRIDSMGIVRNTIYQTSSGREIVLTERPAELTLSEVRITNSPSQSRKAAAQSTPTGANVPVAPTPAAPAPAVQSESAVHTITWIDPSTRRRYSLSGPVPVEELEAIKARLLKGKQ
jgi:hypothetical protein